MPYLTFRVVTDLDVEDLWQMTEKFETALMDADSRFLEVEVTTVRHFQDVEEKEARNV